jgi:hypothetical protein
MNQVFALNLNGNGNGGLGQNQTIAKVSTFGDTAGISPVPENMRSPRGGGQSS